MIIKKKPFNNIFKGINIIPFTFDDKIIWLEKCWYGITKEGIFVAPIKYYPTKGEFEFNFINKIKHYF